MTCDECGVPACTEVQAGWDPRANGGVGGGVYVPLCEGCYAKTEEAAQHMRRFRKKKEEAEKNSAAS